MQCVVLLRSRNAWSSLGFLSQFTVWQNFLLSSLGNEDNSTLLSSCDPHKITIDTKMKKNSSVHSSQPPPFSLRWRKLLGYNVFLFDHHRCIPNVRFLKLSSFITVFVVQTCSSCLMKSALPLTVPHLFSAPASSHGKLDPMSWSTFSKVLAF